MTRFVDEYLNPCVPGYPCISSPRMSTQITRVSSGSEQALQKWQNPLWQFTLPQGVRDQETFESVKDHWLTMRGTFHTWPFRDPLDFASVALARPNTIPNVTMMDQTIGTGDGVNRFFQIVKTYTRGSQTYTRKIYKPVLSTVIVSVNGVLVTTGFSVSRTTGIITFDAPVTAGHVVRCGYLFDCEVRFESDDTFDGIVRSWGIAEFADISLFEVRPC